MSVNLYLQAMQALRRVENMIAFWITGSRFPPGDLCLASSSDVSVISKNAFPSISLENLMQESFLLAVPKSRRTIEKRMQRKFGWPEYGPHGWKPLVPRTNLLTCNVCGHNYEAKCLCPNCYNKVQAETKAMQDAVQAELGLEPVEKEVIVLYKGEKEEHPEEFWEGKRIVEIDRERPVWFSKNLLEKTTQAPSTSKDVKPTELA
ncbi:mitochondrial ribosomal protein L32 [Lycorma delicatula]|uniref:mitochondrial ribosomal protein L32 n=1 Tax=Lycorma delicatula TaxID=130591 RepID=UPI003F51A3F4